MDHQRTSQVDSELLGAFSNRNNDGMKFFSSFYFKHLKKNITSALPPLREEKTFEFIIDRHICTYEVLSIRSFLFISYSFLFNPILHIVMLKFFLANSIFCDFK